jgi:long-subunit acyl-CoA synthetase (AMP-forming)
MTDTIPAQWKQIFYNGRCFTNQDLRLWINAVAGRLRSNTSSNSPFLYLFAHNHIKTVIAFFAAQQAGYTVVLVDPETGPLELREMMADTPPAIEIHIKKDTMVFDYATEIIFTKNTIQDLFLLKEAHDTCCIVYTAADDGFAKAAMLTHKNLITNARAIVEADELSPESVSCSLLPMHHLFGLQTGDRKSVV